MIPKILKERWIVIDGPMGTEYLPLNVWAENEANQLLSEFLNEGKENVFSNWLKDMCENTEAYSLSIKNGFGARLSAPGYMDCTEWSLYETEKEARLYIEESYDVCSYCGESADNSEVNICVCGKEYLS